MKTTLTYLEKYANQIREKHYPNMPRVIVSQEKMSALWGGLAYGSRHIGLPEWILADREQAKSAIRHELAHNVQSFTRVLCLIIHGKEFHQILKRIAPRTWRRDLHWVATPAITQARAKMGIKPRIYSPIFLRLFTCGNPNCSATPKHIYAWKRVPSYMPRGLFKSCKDCGCPTIIEIPSLARKDNLQSFTSIHSLPSRIPSP